MSLLVPPLRVVVQARTSSRRLPGKSLLPVAGYPAAVLATLRASHPDWQTVLATSNDASDDRLARLARAASVQVVRGPLEDVLGRFLVATHGLPDDGIVVRLTADNLFPDASLVREAVTELMRRHLDYLITYSPQLDVPYGLSVEVFRAGALRRAAAEATSTAEREHVTPRIRRAYGVAVHRPRSLPSGSGRLRCTIDSLDDYLRIARVFDSIVNPVRAPWHELCARLAASETTPRSVVPLVETPIGHHGALVVGTAQLGGAYGITNEGREPTDDLALEIVRTAVRHGVTLFDTARAYGESERRLGAALVSPSVSGAPPVGGRDVQVITKLTPLDDVPGDADRRWLANAVDASLFRSCRELGLSSLPIVLLHRAADRLRWRGQVWKRLLALRDQGIIGTLGVSVSTPGEALDALHDPDVRVLQIPFNLLDWRWKKRGVDEATRLRPDVTIHARSPLLQGLLASANAAHWPKTPGIEAQAIVARLERIAQRLGRESLLDLALAYVRSHPWIHGIVTGFATAAQLVEAVRLFELPLLAAHEIEWIEAERGVYPVELLDPARWRA